MIWEINRLACCPLPSFLPFDQLSSGQLFTSRVSRIGEERCWVLGSKEPGHLVNSWERVEIFKITWENTLSSATVTHLIKIIQAWKKEELVSGVLA